MKIVFLQILVLSFSLVFAGCSDKFVDERAAEIAVTNSYIACAVKDVCGDEFEVVVLSGAGMCPGHFDISPSQVDSLCQCKLLLLFDFQKRIQSSLSRLEETGLKIKLISVEGGMCVPQTYIMVCKNICDIVAAEYPGKQEKYQERFEQIKLRMQKLEIELANEINSRNLTGCEVLVSKHQAEFAKWLGFKVIETFVGGDTENISNIINCIKQAQAHQIKFVIANEQEGSALARALAERLKTDVIVFGNFPFNSDQNGFDILLRKNVGLLAEKVLK